MNLYHVFWCIHCRRSQKTPNQSISTENRAIHQALVQLLAQLHGSMIQWKPHVFIQLNQWMVKVPLLPLSSQVFSRLETVKRDVSAAVMPGFTPAVSSLSWESHVFVCKPLICTYSTMCQSGQWCLLKLQQTLLMTFWSVVCARFLFSVSDSVKCPKDKLIIKYSYHCLRYLSIKSFIWHIYIPFLLFDVSLSFTISLVADWVKAGSISCF